ncbi:MAG: FAD-dependent oxidoreductase [Bacillota bacterium]|nr:FAD-dependent oxidoreductase [Bacillota bacterium]
MVIVIIGSSIASKSALETLLPGMKKEDRVIIVTRDRDLFYSRVLLPNYISGELEKKDLFFASRDLVDDRRVSVVNEAVLAVDADNKELRLNSGNTVRYDRLIITAGASPTGVNVDGEHLPGVFYLRDLEDAEGIKDRAKRAKSCVVLGGGLVALKAATAVKKSGAQVKLIVASSRLLSAIADETVSRLIFGSLSAEGIDIRLGASIKQIGGNGQGVRYVALEDGTVIDADMVIAGKGVKPNIDIVKGTGIAVERGIIVDAGMETTVPGVYAAGDVAQSMDYLNTRTGLFTLWPDAVQQGRIAAGSILGLEREYTGGLSMNSFVINGMPFIIIGSIREKDIKGCEVYSNFDERRQVYRKIVIRDGKPVGAAFAGDISYAGMVYWDIRAGRAVEEPGKYITKAGLKQIFTSRLF